MVDSPTSLIDGVVQTSGGLHGLRDDDDERALGQFLGRWVIPTAPVHGRDLVHIEAEVTHCGSLESSFATRVLIEVFSYVTSSFRAGHRSVERGDLVVKPVAVNLVDAQTLKLLRLHFGTPVQPPEVAKYLPSVDLLRVAATILRVAANSSTDWNAHHDCETAIAYGLRAGDHTSVGSSLMSR
jgi:hypothetical protein